MYILERNILVSKKVKTIFTTNMEDSQNISKNRE